MTDFEFRMNSATGDRVRLARESKRITQAQLGEMVGLSAQMVSALEKGDRTWSMPTLVRVARALGLGPGRLLPPADAHAPSPHPDRAAS